MATNPLPSQRATARLRVRDGVPATSAPIASYVEVGGIFQPVSVVEGDDVSGNARWFALAGKKFIWSGASAAVSDRAAITPPSGMRVRRRADGTIKALLPDERESVFGTFEYREGRPRGAIDIDREWTADNIVSIATPILAHLRIRRLQVHRKAAEPFQRVFAKIAAAGLEDRILTCAGTWVARHMGWDPARALSTHSWGAAIDLNAEWNGYGAVPAALGARGSVRELVPIFESEGFAWGGYFRPQTICDGMHFELSRLDL